MSPVSTNFSISLFLNFTSIKLFGSVLAVPVFGHFQRFTSVLKSCFTLPALRFTRLNSRQNFDPKVRALSQTSRFHRPKQEELSTSQFAPRPQHVHRSLKVSFHTVGICITKSLVHGAEGCERLTQGRGGKGHVRHGQGRF